MSKPLSFKPYKMSKPLSFKPYKISKVIQWCTGALLPYCFAALHPYKNSKVIQWCTGALLHYCPAALMLCLKVQLGAGVWGTQSGSLPLTPLKSR